MLIKSARRCVNSDYVAEASFFEEKENVYQGDGEHNGKRRVECDVIKLTFSSGNISYYAAKEDICVYPTIGNCVDCHCDPLFFTDLLAAFFSQ